jgi:hypothetical protein
MFSILSSFIGIGSIQVLRWLSVFSLNGAKPSGISTDIYGILDPVTHVPGPRMNLTPISARDMKIGFKSLI